MTMSLTRNSRLGNSIILRGSSFNTANGNVLIDVDTEKVAIKYFPSSTSPITDIDLYLQIAGIVTDTNFTIQIETDSSDAPSGTVLGAATLEFAGPASSGWIGLKTLVTNTGNLTIGTPVWIVLQKSSGGVLDATDNVRLVTLYSEISQAMCERGRHYNGTNWTTTVATTNPLLFVVKHADADYTGVPFSSGIGNSAVTAIYGTNRQGLRCKIGVASILRGVILSLAKTGSPANLVVEVYEGALSKGSWTLLATAILSAGYAPVFFSSPPTLTANTTLYIVLKQTADGGSVSAYYSTRVHGINSSYISAILNADWRFVYGTGNDPTTFSVSTTELPFIVPIVDDLTVDLVSGGSGGMKVHPGMSGGLNG